MTYLDKALAEGCLPQALLLSGNRAKDVALDLCAKLLAISKEQLPNHLDFHSLVPEGKAALHSIESIRLAIDQSHESPFVGQVAIFLIESADRMQPAAANALLKTLEEPSVASTWILLSERAQDILPTIVSRCTRLSFQQESEPELGEAGEILRKLFVEKPSYPKLALELERLDKLMEGESGQSLLKLASECLHKMDCDPSVWEEPLANVAVALERNMKLSSCLEYMFLKVMSLSR